MAEFYRGSHYIIDAIDGVYMGDFHWDGAFGLEFKNVEKLQCADKNECFRCFVLADTKAIKSIERSFLGTIIFNKSHIFKVLLCCV